MSRQGPQHSETGTRSEQAAVTHGPMQPRSPGARGRIPAGIRVTGSTFRSASVERDDAGLVDTYVLTEPALDLLHRIGAAVSAQRTGAWSVTGAYGTGKSSFAVLLAALLAPEASTAATTTASTNQIAFDASHERALTLLARSDQSLVDKLRGAASSEPMLRALITARREPVGRTVARALTAASTHRWGRRPPGKVAKALAALKPINAGSANATEQDTPPGAEAVLNAVRTMAAAAPLLLVIDEFGKSLEYFASHADDADGGSDLYLLQELAELASGAAAAGCPVYMLTLQHASFLDYAARTEALQRREWSKIQGRFQDVTFAAGPADAAALVAGALDQSELAPGENAALHEYGAAAAARAAEQGLDAVVVTDADVLRASYPLHPLTLAALPLLAGTLGQHDRTLGGFVAGDEPHGVARFLATGAPDHWLSSAGEHDTSHSKVLRTLQLPGLWDYFATAVRGPALASSSASRWIEIETRLSEAHGLPDLDTRILKTVAVLNLVDSSGCLRAGRSNIVFALTDPQQTPDNSGGSTADEAGDIATCLDQLVDRGFLTFRAFSDEYRLWRGSTVDLPARLRTARDELTDQDVAALIQRSYAPAAIVAGRHSQTTGMLRYFQARVSDGTSSAIETAPVAGPADGTAVFHLGHCDTVPSLTPARPVLIGTSADAEQVVDAGREVAALDTVRDTETLDAAAYTEIDERLSVARSELAATLAAAFRPDRPGVVWQLQLPIDVATDSSAELGPARSLSALVSEACDRAYSQSPAVRNEMLGRHQLTSQGAKARRELLAALLEHPGDERAGITGHGPDRAMYDGVVGVLGLHGPTEPSATEYGWTAPAPGHRAHPAWIEAIKLLRSARTPITVEEFNLRLGAPPFGVKAGVLPILLLAALTHTADDVAIFDDGSFVARLTGDIAERMVKTPQRFELRFAPAGTGQRRAALDQLHRALLAGEPVTRHSRTRNSSLVKVVIALLDVVRGLTSYARSTAELTAPARAVREALSTVRDPADLVFSVLPAAVGHAPISATQPVDADAAYALVSDLLSAVEEVRGTDRRLVESVTEDLAEAFKVPGNLATLRRDLAARARVIQGGLADQGLAAFLAHAQREDVPNDDWLDAAVMIIVRNPLASWRDSDRHSFRDRARQLARTFDRVYELYFDSQRTAGEPFHARRITLTRPDGAEHHVVVGLPSSSTPGLTALLDELLTRAGDLDPVQSASAGHTVLAALAERLLDPAHRDVSGEINTAALVDAADRDLAKQLKPTSAPSNRRATTRRRSS